MASPLQLAIKRTPGEIVGHVMHRMRPALRRAAARVHRISTEQWFAVFFALLFALFVFVLFTESTSVGRGGR